MTDMTKGVTAGVGIVDEERFLRLSVRQEHWTAIFPILGASYTNLNYMLQAKTEEDERFGERRVLFRKTQGGGYHLMVDTPPKGRRFLAVYFPIKKNMEWLPSVRHKTQSRVVSCDENGMMIAFKEIKPEAKQITTTAVAVAARKAVASSEYTAPAAKAADPALHMNMEYYLQPDKETKGCYRYGLHHGDPGIGTLYMRKSILAGQEPPSRLQVVITQAG